VRALLALIGLDLYEQLSGAVALRSVRVGAVIHNANGVACYRQCQGTQEDVGRHEDRERRDDELALPSGARLGAINAESCCRYLLRRIPMATCISRRVSGEH
jgi:hypothetical protein